MPLESQWSKIPLGVRWAVCGLVAAALVVLLVRFVESNDGNSLVHVSEKNVRIESRQADVVVGEDQLPVIVHVPAAGSAQAALLAAVRRDMAHRVTDATIDGPLGRIACGRVGRRDGRIGYHCIAEADHVNYPFLAVFTPSAHRVDFCKKDYPPLPSENIPVSSRCRL